ncbi:hypothetical protein L1987_48453 [Smallanthus sonchifolius]|uniref:Uncharacterized protein n=1 Tax=Smallanthus sonchifolius TaxID=185202 RepID=A0ACB9FRZ7_9ASTR|nr:hypothetical protein L1987_48453 [Smallanthus sonchifolius]
MTGQREILNDFRSFDGGFIDFARDKKGGKITRQGTISNDLITLEKFNYVSQLEFNLLSVAQVCDKDIPVHFTAKEYDFSRFSWVFFLAKKDETPKTIIEFVKRIENICDSKVSIIRSDNGTEFKNKLINSFCAEKGITRQFSAARTPQQNGVDERKNRTLIEAAHTMLVDSKLPIIFWAEAVNTSCYVLNRVLMDSLPKVLAVGDECYFLGYSSYHKAFSVHNKRTKIVQESYYVEWQESNVPPVQSGP